MSKLKKIQADTDKEKNELKSQLVRSLADYDNLTKRVEREREEYKTIVTAQLIRRLLPVFDMIYSANEHLNDSGIALTIKELEDTLKNEGLVKIEVKPEDQFNEEYHEVVEVQNKKDIKDGEIIKEISTGWKFKDNDIVIRHAKVVVNKL